MILNVTHTDTSQLKIHQKMVHDTQICKYCYKKFTGVENTMMHINKVHGRRKIHKRQPNINNKRQNSLDSSGKQRIETNSIEYR